MSELSSLKINESQIPIDAYKSIVDHYVSFLKYFYGNEIDLGIKEGSQILQAIKKDNRDINSSLAHDFHERVNKNRFDRKTYKDYHQPIDHLYKIQVFTTMQIFFYHILRKRKKVSLSNFCLKKGLY